MVLRMSAGTQRGAEELPASFEERATRAETNWIALIRTSEGVEIPCSVKDVSKTGAKIGVPASYPLPDSFMLKVLGKDFVCRVSLAWRRGHFAGVRIEQIGKIAQRPPALPKQSDVSQCTLGAQHKAIGSHRSRISSF